MHKSCLQGVLSQVAKWSTEKKKTPWSDALWVRIQNEADAGLEEEIGVDYERV